MGEAKDVRDTILQELRDLHLRGQTIMQQCGFHEGRYQVNPDDYAFKRYKTQAMNLVARVCGESSEHYRELRRLAEDARMGNSGYYLHHYVAVVHAGLQDFEKGLLFDLRALIAAELLGDFNDQAAHLLAAGYRDPAASLAGAVLEDMLRRLSDKDGISHPAKTSIDALNTNLAKAGVYNKLVQKQITALADIRNNADHGHFDKYGEQDVQHMVSWIRRFGADYLGR